MNPIRFHPALMQALGRLQAEVRLTVVPAFCENPRSPHHWGVAVDFQAPIPKEVFSAAEKFGLTQGKADHLHLELRELLPFGSTSQLIAIYARPENFLPLPPCLCKGNTGNAVGLLQKALNTHDAALTVDGIFGAQTETAVRRFQRQRRLKVDGVAGHDTWDRLTAE